MYKYTDWSKQRRVLGWRCTNIFTVTLENLYMHPGNQGGTRSTSTGYLGPKATDNAGSKESGFHNLEIMATVAPNERCDSTIDRRISKIMSK